MATEIIVYRNPLEKAIWDSISGGNLAFGITAALTIMAGILTYAYAEQAYRTYRGRGLRYCFRYLVWAAFWAVACGFLASATHGMI